ncbi:MAG: hypothetical protein JO044_04705 [Mycobacteriaceae bacterium]|nr:hypothetical protein [Mycobacteriaceae bacterium]
MALEPRYFTLLPVCAGVAASIALAPSAAADSGVLPVAGSENASDTLNDLTAQGYDVQINWVNGYPHVSLSQCWVNSINTADATGSLRTAYVDIECPK